MYSTPRIVTSSDCDQSGYQTPTSMVTMMQDCSGLWLESEPAIDDYIIKNKLALIITSRQLDIFRRPLYRERLNVVTSVYQFKGPLGFRNTCIYDEQGKAVAKCWCTGPYFDLNAGKIVKLPKKISDTMLVEPKVEMEYLPRKIALPDEEPQQLSPVPVVPSDIDYYRHVNNAQYVRIACDNLPQEFSWNRMRVEYKSQAKLGMDIHPAIVMADDKVFMTLHDGDNNPFTVMEFSEF